MLANITPLMCNGVGVTHYEKFIIPLRKSTNGGGLPCLTYFSEGKKEYPLVVFISGGPVMSRIAYGHSGGQSKDFLAYWFKEGGNPFLAVTHTMDHPIFTNAYPEFSVQDFGRQVAEVIDETTKQHGLLKEVIVIAFSAGGRIIESLCLALEPYSISIGAFIALNALTPQITLVSHLKRGFEMSEREYAVAHFDPFFEQNLLMQETANKRSIIHESTFKQDYLGNFPINVWESIYRYHQGAFVPALEEGLNDTGAFAYFHYPLIGVITGDSPKDLRNTLMNSGIWGFYQVQAIYQNYFAFTQKDLTHCQIMLGKRFLI